MIGVGVGVEDPATRKFCSETYRRRASAEAVAIDPDLSS